MNNKFTIEAILKASGADQFSKDFQNATKSMEGIGRASKKSTGGLKSFLGGVGKIAGAIGVTKLVSAGFNAIRSSVDDAVSRVDTLNQFPKVLQQMGASGEEAEWAIDRLAEGIEGLPTKLDDVAGDAQRMFTILGDAELATESTLALNNAFLASGASTADASRGLEQYMQMLSTGKVDMQSWRTLQETMPYALKETAEAFGFTGEAATNDFYDALQSGEVTMSEVNEKMIELSNETGGFAETALTATEGISTSWQNLQTAISRNVANVIEAYNDWASDAGFLTISEIIDKMKEAVDRAFGSIIEAIPAALEWFINLFNTISESTAFQSLKEVIQGVIEVGKELITSFLQSEAWQGFIDILKEVANALLELNFVELLETWAPLIAGIVGAIAAFQLIMGVMNAFNAVMGLVSAAVSVGGAAIAFLTSPIGIVVAAIGVLVAVMVYLYQTNETVREAIDAAWTFIKDLIMRAVAVISEYVQSVFGGLVTWWQENNQMILEAAQNVWNAIQAVIEVAMSIISSIMQTLWPMIMAVVKFAWDGIKNIIDGVTKVITGIIQAFSALFTGNWSALWDAVKQIVSGAVQAIWGFIQLWIVGKIIGAVKVFAGMMKSLFSSAWAVVRNIFSSSLSWIGGNVSSGLGAVKATFTTILNALKGIVTGAFSGVRAAFSSGMSNALSTVTNFFGSFKSAGANIVSNIAQGITGAIGKVTGAVKGVLKAARNLLPFSPPKDKSSPMVGLEKNGIVGNIAQGIMNNEGEIQKAMNRALDVDMPMMNGQISHSVNMNNGRTENLLEQLVNSNQVIVLDSGELVGATYPQYDRVGGSQTQLTERWGR